MQPNSLYDLMIQFVEESKSLWRLKSDYPENAASDEALAAYWAELAADKEAHLVDLKALIKSRLG